MKMRLSIPFLVLFMNILLRNGSDSFSLSDNSVQPSNRASCECKELELNVTDWNNDTLLIKLEGPNFFVSPDKQFLQMSYEIIKEDGEDQVPVLNIKCNPIIYFCEWTLQREGVTLPWVPMKRKSSSLPQSENEFTIYLNRLADEPKLTILPNYLINPFVDSSPNRSLAHERDFRCLEIPGYSPMASAGYAGFSIFHQSTKLPKIPKTISIKVSSYYSHLFVDIVIQKDLSLQVSAKYLSTMIPCRPFVEGEETDPLMLIGKKPVQQIEASERFDVHTFEAHLDDRNLTFHTWSLVGSEIFNNILGHSRIVNELNQSVRIEIDKRILIFPTKVADLPKLLELDPSIGNGTESFPPDWVISI